MKCTENEEKSTSQFNSKPIFYNPAVKTIQRIALYETKSRFYVVGSNNTQSRFRVLKIDRQSLWQDWPKKRWPVGASQLLDGTKMYLIPITSDKLGWQDGPMETEHQRRHDRVQQQGDTGAPHHDRCGKQAKKMIIWLSIQSPVSLILKFQVNQLNCSRLLGIMSLRRFLCKPHWQNTQIF